MCSFVRVGRRRQIERKPTTTVSFRKKKVIIQPLAALSWCQSSRITLLEDLFEMSAARVPLEPLAAKLEMIL